MVNIVNFENKYATALYKIHCEEMPEEDKMTEKNFYDEFKQNTRKYFVALQNDEPIGYIGLFNMIDDYNIIGIAVKSCNQQSGVGTKLLNKAIEEARNVNIKSLSLEVDEKNAKAISFYKKNGFKVTNIRKKYYKDNDAFIMWLYL